MSTNVFIHHTTFKRITVHTTPLRLLHVSNNFTRSSGSVSIQLLLFTPKICNGKEHLENLALKTISVSNTCYKHIREEFSKSTKH